MTIVLYETTLHVWKQTSAFAKHSLSLFFVPQEMSLNIDITRIFPVKFSGVSPNLLSRSVSLP